MGKQLFLIPALSICMKESSFKIILAYLCPREEVAFLADRCTGEKGLSLSLFEICLSVDSTRSLNLCSFDAEAPPPLGCASAHCVQLLATLWTVAHQAPLSEGFPRQEYWSGLPFPSPGDLSDQGLNSHLLHCRWMLY